MSEDTWPFEVDPYAPVDEPITTEPIPVEEVVSDLVIDDLAREVVRGEHGVGDKRRESLGVLYSRVQQRVKQLRLQSKWD